MTEYRGGLPPGEDQRQVFQCLLVPPGDVRDQIPHRPRAGDTGFEHLLVTQPGVRLLELLPGGGELVEQLVDASVPRAHPSLPGGCLPVHL